MQKLPPKSKESGQSLVELALTITLLMVLLAGTIDLGRAFFTWMALRDAAQEGAAFGSISPSDVAGIELRVRDNLEQVNLEGTVTVTRTIIGAACLGNTIQIDVDYLDFPLTMPFLGAIVGGQTIPIHATINDTILKPTCGQ